MRHCSRSRSCSECQGLSPTVCVLECRGSSRGSMHLPTATFGACGDSHRQLPPRCLRAIVDEDGKKGSVDAFHSQGCPGSVALKVHACTL
eukprot:2769862-Rhodomonas_salina.8